MECGSTVENYKFIVGLMVRVCSSAYGYKQAELPTELVMMCTDCHTAASCFVQGHQWSNVAQVWKQILHVLSCGMAGRG
jgi:hypothetical protein